MKNVLLTLVIIFTAGNAMHSADLCRKSRSQSYNNKSEVIIVRDGRLT